MVINVMQKNRTQKIECVSFGRELYMLRNEDLKEKVTFKQNPEGSDKLFTVIKIRSTLEALSRGVD